MTFEYGFPEALITFEYGFPEALMTFEYGFPEALIFVSRRVYRNSTSTVRPPATPMKSPFTILRALASAA